MMKTVHFLLVICYPLMSLSVLTIAAPFLQSLGTVDAPSSAIFGSLAQAAVKQPPNNLQRTQHMKQSSHSGPLSHSISLKSTPRYGGAIVAKARRNGGSNGSSGDNDFFDYFSRKNHIIKEFLVAKAKNLTIPHTNPQHIEACIMELLLSMVALHIGEKVIYMGILYSNTGKQTERKDFQQNFKMQEDTLSKKNMETIGPADIRLIGAILGEWVMAKRRPKVVFTGEDEDEPAIVFDRDLTEDFFKLLLSSEEVGKQLAQEMDNEIERLNPNPNPNRKKENYIILRHQQDRSPIYHTVKEHKFDLLGIFGWTFMAFGEEKVLDAIRLILLLRMLLDGQLTGQGLLDYLQHKCVPIFHDNEKRDEYIQVLEELAEQMGWFNHQEFPDGIKNIFVYRHKIDLNQGEPLKKCESFGDESELSD